MPVLKICLASLIGLMLTKAATAQGFASGNAALDAEVEACLETDGVTFDENTQVLCYNAAIFPEQFLKLRELPPADKIIITSPGGNVATARVMSTILDERAEPAVIAGPCMSACAMVLLPGLDSVYIHRSAHIAVHGIAMMDYHTWWGWLRDDAVPGTMARLQAQLGYDFDYILHHSGREHMEEHLAGQDVALPYIDQISAQMLLDALDHDCRVDPKDYWGMLDAEHLQTWLGDRITGMEAFAQSWADPNNLYFTDIAKAIGEQTYVFNTDYDEAICS